MSFALTSIYMRFCGSTVAIENTLKIVKNVVDMQRTHHGFHQLKACFYALLKL